LPWAYAHGHLLFQHISRNALASGSSEPQKTGR